MNSLVRTPTEASAAIDVLHELHAALRARGERDSLAFDLIEDMQADLRVKRDELHAAEMSSRP